MWSPKTRATMPTSSGIHSRAQRSAAALDDAQRCGAATMKRDRGDGGDSAACDDGAGDDADADDGLVGAGTDAATPTRDLARAIAAARAQSVARRHSTWLDTGGDVEHGPGGRRVEINFPGSKEEYEQLLLASGANATLTKDGVGKKLRKNADGDGEDDDAAWGVAAVIVPEDVRENGSAGRGDGDEDAEASGRAVGGKWVQSYDAESDDYYYFHAETHETMWERPVGVDIILDETAVAKIAQDEAEKEARLKAARERSFAEARTDADVTEDALQALKAHTSVDVANVKLPGAKSWYYEDDSGQWQGPFTAAQLMAWRSMLPMELRLFEHDDEEAECTLADVLGDAPLVAQCAALGVVLPPRATAAHAQQALREARSGGVVPEYEADGDVDGAEAAEAPKSEWERAVLDGLPPEQAIMRGADPAEIARQVIEQRVAAQEASYGASGVYNKFLHKITDASTIAKPTSVYENIGLDRYVDTRTLDDALHAMKNRKVVKLTKKQIEILKRRKAQIKDRINNEWLRKDD